MQLNDNEYEELLRKCYQRLNELDKVRPRHRQYCRSQSLCTCCEEFMSEEDNHIDLSELCTSCAEEFMFEVAHPEAFDALPE